MSCSTQSFISQVAPGRGAPAPPPADLVSLGAMDFEDVDEDQAAS